MYLLDTNACIKILNESSTELIERFQSKTPSEIQLCSVVKAELVYGARKSARPAEQPADPPHVFLPIRLQSFR